MLKINAKTLSVASCAVALAGAAVYLIAKPNNDKDAPANPTIPQAAPTTVKVTDKQLQYITVANVGTHAFVEQSEAVGYLDFNQDRNVQVFSPWAGRITQVLAKAGDDVTRGQTLYVIDSPDLVQAESTLISTAGLLKLTKAAKDRAQSMLGTQAVAQKDYDQAVSDHQTAEANYKAARDAVHIFGKTDAEMDALIAAHKPDGALHITSPIAGRVTARAAAEGTLVQPGNAPAPFTVADISTLWMVANVSEYDLPKLALGQTLTVHVAAYPNDKFSGQINYIGAAVDPNTHRIAVRAEMHDAKHQLRPQMLATFQIRTSEPVASPAIPQAGVVREGDGTMTAFVTRDKHTFERRTVQVGAQQDGYTQILKGVTAGEQVATDGALLLSNALALETR